MPLPDRLAATLTGQWDAAAPLYPDLTAQTIRQAMRRACVAASLRHLTSHDLRHRFISRLVLAGVPITLIQRVVGHGRASVTLDVDSHVLLDEPPGSLEALRRFVRWDASRKPGDADLARLSRTASPACNGQRHQGD